MKIRMIDKLSTNYIIKSFFIFFIYLLILKNILLEKKLVKNIKVCLCTIGKNENLYSKEFVNHYKNYGINKIFIYDNNDIGGEKFEEILIDYIKNGLVEIINYRGLISPQIKAYQNCHENNYNNYNWIIFYDMDEYIFLKRFKNIKFFLNRKIFNKCQRIQLNLVVHTDNNLLYYDNRTLKERFPEVEENARGKKKGGYAVIKSIIRGKIKIRIVDPHIISSKLISCDGFGKIKNIENIRTNESDYTFNYIDHYFSKSTEEFIKKLLRGSAVHGFKIEKKKRRIKEYFEKSEITLNKINFIEKKTHMKTYLFPSLENQSCKNFTWILMIGNKINITYIKSLISFNNLFESKIIYIKEIKNYIKNITKGFDVLITTRIDYDDRIYYQAVNDVRRVIDINRPMFLYGYNRGVQYFESDGKYYDYYFDSNNEGVKSIFISLITVLNKVNNIYTIYDLGNNAHIRKKLLKNYKLYGIKELNYEPAIFENGEPKFVWVRQKYSGLYNQTQQIKKGLKINNFNLNKFYGK